MTPTTGDSLTELLSPLLGLKPANACAPRGGTVHNNQPAYPPRESAILWHA